MGKREVTQIALLRAAEKLFAERGVDNVSLREIAAAAGQRNNSAAAYHFGDKRELIEALLHRHSGPIDDAFVPAIERLRAEGRESLRELAALLVRPLVAKLDDEDGGTDYILIAAELVNSRTHPITGLRAANGAGSAVFRERLMVYMTEIPPMLLPVRMLRTAAVLFGSIAAYHRLCIAGLYVPREDFSVDLIGSMTALFASGAGSELSK